MIVNSIFQRDNAHRSSRAKRVATWFGYHEWWHAWTLAAGVCFFAMNAWLIASA